MGEFGVKRVVMLTLGWEDLPESWSINHADPTSVLREPVPAVLIETASGWVILDSGFNKALIEDSALYNRFHGRFFDIKPVLPAYSVDPLLDSLNRFGIQIDHIAAVGISHLHNDHSGGIRHFAGTGTPIFIQNTELTFALDNQSESEANGYARVDYDDPRIRWERIEGDQEIAPGVTAIYTPGHTPGHQSFRVDFPHDGANGLIFAFDAGDLIENFDHELAIGGFINVTPEDTVTQIRKLKEVAKLGDLQIIPGHDPRVWPTQDQGLARELAPY